MSLSDAQQAVKEFMERVCQIEIASKPEIAGWKEAGLCVDLVEEEVHELYQAIDEKNIVEIADAIADSIYVLLYTANVYGIDIAPIFEEVQRSNMTKVGGTINSRGKLVKPKTYEPANLLPIIMRQINATNA